MPLLFLEALTNGRRRTSIKILDTVAAVQIPAAPGILDKLPRRRTSHHHNRQRTSTDLQAANMAQVSRRSNQARESTQTTTTRSTVNPIKASHNTLKIPPTRNTSNHILERSLVLMANLPNIVTTPKPHLSPLLQPVGTMVPRTLPPLATVNKTPPTHLIPKIQITRPTPVSSILPLRRVHLHIHHSSNLAVCMAATVSLLNSMEAQDNIPVRRLVQATRASHRTEGPLGGKLMTIRAVMDMGSRLVGTARSQLKETHMVVQVLRQYPDGGHKNYDSVSLLRLCQRSVL